MIQYIFYSGRSKNRYGEPDNGYYVSYKDKLSDKWSPNWIEAKRYKEIGTLLAARLFGKINYAHVKVILDKFNDDEYVKRQKKLARLNKIKFEPNYDHIKVFDHNCRIDVIDINGNDIKYLGPISNNQLYNFFKKKHDQLERALPINKWKKKNPDDYKEIETEETNLEDEFWN